MQEKKKMVFKNIYVNGLLSNIEIYNGRIQSVGNNTTTELYDSNVVDFKGQAWALPGMVNMHTHSAMTLMRSCGSGLPLHQWLHNTIFPIEARLTPNDVYR